jgi:hypothetical protein
MTRGLRALRLTYGVVLSVRATRSPLWSALEDAERASESG